MQIGLTENNYSLVSLVKIQQTFYNLPMGQHMRYLFHVKSLFNTILLLLFLMPHCYIMRNVESHMTVHADIKVSLQYYLHVSDVISLLPHLIILYVLSRYANHVNMYSVKGKSNLWFVEHMLFH